MAFCSPRREAWRQLLCASATSEGPFRTAAGRHRSCDSLRRIRAHACASPASQWSRIDGMTRQDANAGSRQTSFLYGGNAAFVEDLYARWAADPNSVEPSWRAFFEQPRGRRRRRDAERRAGRVAAARLAAAAARRPGLGARRRLGRVGKSVAQAQGQGAAQGRRAPARRGRSRRRCDSLRAIMMIRAYRMRGHLQANLDPLGLEPPSQDAPSSIRPPTASPKPTSTGRSSSTTCWAWRPRPCARSSRSCGAPTAATSACSTCTSPIPTRRRGCSSASRAATRRSPSPPRARSRS